MSRRGNCWDNAVAESFFSSFKKERIKKRIDMTREIATAEIYEYIEPYYHHTRRHSHLSGVSPEAFEAMSNPTQYCVRKSLGSPRGNRKDERGGGEGLDERASYEQSVRRSFRSMKRCSGSLGEGRKSKRS